MQGQCRCPRLQCRIKTDKLEKQFEYILHVRQAYQRSDRTQWCLDFQTPATPHNTQATWNCCTTAHVSVSRQSNTCNTTQHNTLATWNCCTTASYCPCHSTTAIYCLILSIPHSLCPSSHLSSHDTSRPFFCSSTFTAVWQYYCLKNIFILLNVALLNICIFMQMVLNSLHKNSSKLDQSTSNIFQVIILTGSRACTSTPGSC